MKTMGQITGLIATGLLIMVTVNISAQEKDSFVGSWEGYFMNDFKTLIQLECDSAQKFTGRILMFDGTKQIQDDELFKISIEEYRLTFYIMAKETHYKGELNPSNGELSGIFIFPDDSEHPLTLKKKDATPNE